MGLVRIYIPDRAMEKLAHIYGGEKNAKLWCKRILLEEIREKFGEEYILDGRKRKRKTNDSSA